MQGLYNKRRLISLSLAVVFGAGLTVAFLHRATEIHGYCSEHGEQIHLDHHADEHVAHGGATMAPAPDHGQGVHDCGALLFLSQGQDRPQAPTHTAQLAAAPLRHQYGHDAPSSLPPLTRSPKTSPPHG